MKIVKHTLEHLNKGTDMIDLPEYFRGTEKQCKGMMLRFELVKDQSLFGGYWRDEDGECYYLLP